jgi:shikimate kinase
MRRILVTGVSGVGKSTVVVRLGELGYRAVDLDSPEWSEWVESADGGGPTPLEPGKDWVWREDRVRELLADEGDGLVLAEDGGGGLGMGGGGVLFVSGCAPNLGAFRDRFDGVVLLSVTADVMAERLAHRTTNAYGKHPGELARSLEFKETVEPLLRATADLELDGAAPLEQVVADVIRFARR